jgi:DNA-directed RNA polymerase specialized sigma24 family protein
MQKVFNLYAIDGYSHKEIGEMLGFPEGTSKWHLSKARGILREMVEKHSVGSTPTIRDALRSWSVFGNR